MVNLDRYNRNILRELEDNGRISNTDLAARVGLSPSACLRRVQELEKSGVIAGYHAALNPAALGIGFIAYLAVGLGDHTLPSQLGFEEAMRDSDEVAIEITLHEGPGESCYWASDLTCDYVTFNADYHT